MSESTRAKTAMARVEYLLAGAKALEEFWPAFRAQVDKDRVDKYDAGFEVDDRFVALSIPTRRGALQFCAYSGVYGNSSCYTESVNTAWSDKDIAKYFYAALNKYAEAIFVDMAALARADAKKLAAEARESLDSLDAALQEIELRDFSDD